jgi:hypothetical protein
MPSHRKERGPGPRHRALGVRRRPRQRALTGPEAPRSSRARYLRMLMATPQFAAGAGIVIAALLSMDVPHAALTYGPNPPVHECAYQACATPKPAPGGLATSKPSIKLKPPRHQARRPAATSTPAQAVRRGHHAVTVLQYQTIDTSSSGFVAMIIVDSTDQPGTWSLALSFADAQVQHVWGAQWHPDAAGTGGVATGQPWPWPGQKPGASRIVIFANGRSSAPTSCTFNGKPCRFG